MLLSWRNISCFAASLSRRELNAVTKAAFEVVPYYSWISFFSIRDEPEPPSNHFDKRQICAPSQAFCVHRHHHKSSILDHFEVTQCHEHYCTLFFSPPYTSSWERAYRIYSRQASSQESVFGGAIVCLVTHCEASQSNGFSKLPMNCASVGTRANYC